MSTIYYIRVQVEDHDDKATIQRVIETTKEQEGVMGAALMVNDDEGRVGDPLFVDREIKGI